MGALLVATAALPVRGEDSHKEEPLKMGSNRLANEVSPYLQLHAHNPVDWYPWGEEALEKARREDKPIFLSVGYSTCYWCHVMERLVFSDVEIAALMNEWFVNIKVDREERPDLDQIYMTATQLLSGNGGWPNSVFLTPDLQPFFAGTYFPPQDAHGRPGFPHVLRKLHEAWEVRRAEVLKVAARLTTALREAEAGQQAPSMEPDSVLVERSLSAIKGRYDAHYGGFGGAPKFPPCMRLEFLLAAPERFTDERAMTIVDHTLRAMARGGIYDQVGGGFHRYATDVEWRVPHFEKMLYNQAHLARLYLRAYQATGREEWRRLAKDIFRFVRREMTAPDGPFYSALDAETEAVEGKYYLWTEEEIGALLGEDAELFFEVYDLEPVPEGEGEVIYLKTSFEEAAAALEMELPVLRERIERMRGRLLKARAGRTYPLLDDKIVTAWNGMMIAAYAYGYEVLGIEEYRDAAAAAATFILDKMRGGDGGLKRTYRQGEVRYDAFLEDYAFLTQGLLNLYRATRETRWLSASEEIAAQMVTRFWDTEQGGFFFTESAADLIVRSKNAQDSALPAANAVAVHCLLDLAQWSGREDYLEKARQTLNAFGGMMRAQPVGFTHMIAAAERYLDGSGDQGTAVAEVKSATVVSDSLVQLRVELSTLEPVPGERFQAVVHLDISDGWHVNAHPAAAEWLIPTTLTLNADLPVDVLEVHYPEAVDLYFAATGETLKVYQGEVTLRAELRLLLEAEGGQEGDLRLLVEYQACDEARCLQPAELFQSARLRVGDR